MIDKLGLEPVTISYNRESVPFAYVEAHLALGKYLTDVMNSVTNTTTACFGVDSITVV